MPCERFFLEWLGVRVEIPTLEGIRFRRYQALGWWHPPAGIRLVVEPL